MKHLLKNLLALLLVVCFVSAQAQRNKASNKKNKDQKANTWLWQVSGNGLKTPSYLYGTMHAMCSNDFSMDDSLLAKLNASSQLVLEVVDADNPMNVFVLMQAMAMKGAHLNDLYTPEEYAEINKFFTDSVGVGIDELAAFNPFFAILATMPVQMGCADIKSYEAELTQLARTAGKEVKELETIQFQANLFDTIPYGIQAKELLRLVREWNSEKQLLAEMTSIYKNKEVDKALVLAHASFGALTQYWDVFLKNRNENWVPKIEAMAAVNSSLFAVGAAHLVGDYGLIALLRKKGYTVTPVNN
jgi:uncharacterized protein